MAFDREFEVEIISAAANDFAYRERVKRIVRDTDPWSSAALYALWKLVAQLGKQDKLTGSLVAKVADEYDDDDDYEEFAACASEVFACVPSVAGYAAGKLEAWVHRKTLIDGAAAIVDRLGGDDVEGAQALISKLSNAGGGLNAGVEGGDWFAAFDERQKQRLEEKLNPDLRPVVKTRIDGLDEDLAGGLRAEELGLIVGFTNVGKSFIALNFAFVSALSGTVTVYISTEMSLTLVDTRLDARLFRIESSDFDEHKFTKKQLDEIEARWKRVEARLQKKLYTYATPMNSLTKAGLEQILDDVERESGAPVGLLVLDSADHMLPMVPIREKRLQQSAVYWDVKTILAERKLACWSTCHAPGSYKALLTEFDQAESKEKGKIASKIVTANQSPKELKKDILRLYVAKNRAGKKGGTHYVQTDYARASIVGIEKPDEDEEDEDE